MGLAIEDYLALRCRALNSHKAVSRGRDFVLVWLQQTLRGEHNPVIDAALLMGRRLRKPVVVYHGLGQQYPHASDRHHTFILQASQSLESSVRDRGIAFHRHVETADRQTRGLLYQLADRATAVFVDDVAAFVGRWQVQSFARRTSTLVLAVDGLRLVPEQALGGVVNTTPAFRRLAGEQREDWLAEPFDLDCSRAPFAGEMPTPHCKLNSAESIRKIVAECTIDHSLPPVPWCTGHRDQAVAQLHWAAHTVVPVYASRRNDPSDPSGVTRLSPYLHFGVLAPAEVVAASDHDGVDSRNRWKFLDELLTWREYWHHRSVHVAIPSAYDNVPASARATLAKHASDPRAVVYSLDELTHGETADTTWNAAQKQFLNDGWMHNNLRMYWGKQLIGWRPSPEDAWTVACYLNDRLSLDGRDPATYGSMLWCFGASRPAREAPVYGTVPRKRDTALRRRCAGWLDAQSVRPSIRIEIPEVFDRRTRPQASGAAETELRDVHAPRRTSKS